MKESIFTLPLFVGLLFLFTACESGEQATVDAPVAVAAAPDANLPANFKQVLDAHGGLSAWNENRQLSYAMPRGEGKEMQLVDLRDRREYISQPAQDGTTVEQGYDGANVWITADTTYKGNPQFYKNLMFYFYAMPWVLADPGIQYSDAEPLVFEGTTYPGILVGYDDGIGFSPKDNYRVHYDSETKEMRWLGYTVTGRSGKSSDKFSWIEYPTWTDHGGAQLPDSLVWYKVENNLPVEPRNTRVFSDVKLDKKAADSNRFTRPEGARIVK